MPYKSTEAERANASRYYAEHGAERRAKQNAYSPEYIRRLSTKYLRLLQEARRRNKVLTLCQEDYELIVKDAQCFYCDGNLPETGCGLDRLDHFEGYRFGNVVPCCRECNEQKGKLESAGFEYPRTAELMHEMHNEQFVF